jgi:hypothetical protein
MDGDPWEDTTMTDERPLDNPGNPDEPAATAGSTPSDSGDATRSEAGGEGAGWPSGDSMWKETSAEADSSGAKMVSQLQQMIDQIATQARPAARQIGIKAAELTALAAERAGPAAHKAGDVAADASSKLAVRSREFADALRRELGVSENGASTADAASDAASDAAADAGSTATAVMDRAEETIGDAAEKTEDQANS